MTTLTPQQLESLVDDVLLSALQRFAADVDVATLGKLQTWLEEHEQAENIFAEAVQQFPLFGGVLAQEMERAAAQVFVAA